jgi:hypothetical protein
MKARTEGLLARCGTLAALVCSDGPRCSARYEGSDGHAANAATHPRQRSPNDVRTMHRHILLSLRSRLSIRLPGSRRAGLTSAKSPLTQRPLIDRDQVFE